MNVDQVTYCSRFPADGETLVAERYAQGFGGKGANQAVMAAGLGARVAMVGCLGDDDLGDATMANFAARGIDAAGVVRIPGLSSGVAPIWVDGTGTNRILIVPGANAALTPEHVTKTLAGRRAHVVLAQLETPQAATAEAFAWAHSVGARTVLNTAPAAPVEARIIDQVDWLVANESEFALLGGAEPTPAAIAETSDQWRCGVVVTLGSSGALVAAPGEQAASVPAPSVIAVDTTGAGDAFVGAFAVAIAAGATPHEAVRLGCIAGALSVQRPGTQTSFPGAAEVLAS
jgi:ribokinase